MAAMGTMEARDLAEEGCYRREECRLGGETATAVTHKHTQS